MHAAAVATVAKVRRLPAVQAAEHWATVAAKPACLRVTLPHTLQGKLPFGRAAAEPDTAARHKKFRIPSLSRHLSLVFGHRFLSRPIFQLFAGLLQGALIVSFARGVCKRAQNAAKPREKAKFSVLLVAHAGRGASTTHKRVPHVGIGITLPLILTFGDLHYP